MKKHCLFLLGLIIFISCSGGKLPFKAQGFGGGFGGPQNKTESRAAKTINNNPIIFVHGYGVSASYFWPARSWFLERGYNAHEVFSIEFTDNFMTVMMNAARELRAFVKKVLKYTGRRKVVLVGHSRGVSIIRLFIRGLNGKALVSHAVYIAGALHGHSLATNPNYEHYPSSAFIRQMNMPTETLPEIKYLCIRADMDKFFKGSLASSPFLKGAKNVTINNVVHLEVGRDERTLAEILKFLKEG